MKKRAKHGKIRYIVLGLLAGMVLVALIWMHFGGFGTGETANPEEFAEYAKPVADLVVPENASIIALGEATHGNVEFQQLKLDVFKQMVEQYDVKAFALEGDFGGCERVNRYIQGGEGTAQEAAAAIGFALYRTEEMAQLISYMRQYNETAAEGESLRFYGFDMQRPRFSFTLLIEACNAYGVDTTELQTLMGPDDWNGAYDAAARTQTITQVKHALEEKEASAQAIRLTDVLLQHCELATLMASPNSDGIARRDQWMAENVEWILRQEQQLGHARIFITGHNGHVGKWGSYDSMGTLLSKQLANGYYVIGTDFYKTECNLPSGTSGNRTNQVFYSHDPLAKAAKLAGLPMCWLDFSAIPSDTELSKLVADYTYIGNLGESYSPLMRLLPPSYRMFQQPAVLYDSMIFVADASPTQIVPE